MPEPHATSLRLQLPQLNSYTFVGQQTCLKRSHQQESGGSEATIVVPLLPLLLPTLQIPRAGTATAAQVPSAHRCNAQRRTSEKQKPAIRGMRENGRNTAPLKDNRSATNTYYKTMVRQTERKQYGKYSTAHTSSPRDVPEQIQRKKLLYIANRDPHQECYYKKGYLSQSQPLETSLG